MARKNKVHLASYRASGRGRIPECGTSRGRRKSEKAPVSAELRDVTCKHCRAAAKRNGIKGKRGLLG